MMHVLNWISENAVTVGGWFVTLLLTVAGWVIDGVHTRKKAADDINNKQNELDAAEKRENTLKDQLNAQRQAAEALQKQVDQLKKANRLFEEANPPDADPWSQAVIVRGMQYRVTNEGSKDVVVEKVEPDDNKLPLVFDRKVPFNCGMGDGFDCVVPGTGSGTAAINITWHFDRSTERRTTRRPV